jgi:hypothetical protein
MKETEIKDINQIIGESDLILLDSYTLTNTPKRFSKKRDNYSKHMNKFYLHRIKSYLFWKDVFSNKEGERKIYLTKKDFDSFNEKKASREIYSGKIYSKKATNKEKSLAKLVEKDRLLQKELKEIILKKNRIIQFDYNPDYLFYLNKLEKIIEEINFSSLNEKGLFFDEREIEFIIAALGKIEKKEKVSIISRNTLIECLSEKIIKEYPEYNNNLLFFSPLNDLEFVERRLSSKN